ncbi:MAG TPA: hypothetical protein DDY88_06875 [Actinobacteria bacterium]|nr:hypothetical protein [Actinomycetota bacterium]
MAPAAIQILVQLGPIPDFVWHYAVQNHQLNPQFATVLIADAKAARPREGISVVQFDTLVSTAELQELTLALESSNIDPHWRKGYWLRIYGRFLALRNYCNQSGLDPGTPVIHLESDMANFITEQLLDDSLREFNALNLMAFIDADTACPGVILSRTPAAMAMLCSTVLEDVQGGRNRSDMKSLALAGSQLLQPLATLPEQSKHTMQVRTADANGVLSAEQPASLIFDAAAVGQYLFGIDPRNQQGLLVPGYRETRGGLDPGLWQDWSLALCQDGITRVTARAQGRLLVLANLHIHAKIIIPRPEIGSDYWRTQLGIANGLIGARPQFVSQSRLSQLIFRNLRRLS